MSLRLTPITQKAAKAFISRHHRHNDPSITAVFVLAVQCEGVIVGVAMVGYPKARLLADGRTLEVTRTCTTGARNANSMLYGAAARVAAAMGYERLMTYTLPEESGASLKAVGWRRDEKLTGGGVAHWADRRGADLFGRERFPQGQKVRWWKALSERSEAP